MSDKPKCKAEVERDLRTCKRDATWDGYCGQHHPKAVAERERRLEERWRIRHETVKVAIRCSEIKAEIIDHLRAAVRAEAKPDLACIMRLARMLVEAEEEPVAA